MTFWQPDTCKCYCHVENKQLINKCKIHNTYQETLKHNQSFNLKKNITKENLAKLKQQEKLKT